MRHDAARLDVLRRSLILDSPEEQAYDDITRALASLLGVPIAMVNLLDAERDWFKSRVGIDLRESPASTSFCQALLDTPGDVIVAQDTAADDRFAGHPLVAGEPHIRFYIAARLVVGGQTLGTLCAYDLQPRVVDARQIEDLRVMATAVSDLLRRRAPE